MSTANKSYLNVLAAGLLGSALCVAAPISASAQTVNVKPNEIGGVVTGAHGPEAGVWVIAETKETNTPFVKIVVTDDQGRYTLPQLPSAVLVWAESTSP